MLFPLTAHPDDQTVDAMVKVTGPGNVTVCVPLDLPALHEYQAALCKNPADFVMYDVESPIKHDEATLLFTFAPKAIELLEFAVEFAPMATLFEARDCAAEPIATDWPPKA